jgi:hypothetical protein
VLAYAVRGGVVGAACANEGSGRGRVRIGAPDRLCRGHGTVVTAVAARANTATGAEVADAVAAARVGADGGGTANARGIGRTGTGARAHTDAAPRCERAVEGARRDRVGGCHAVVRDTVVTLKEQQQL